MVTEILRDPDPAAIEAVVEEWCAEEVSTLDNPDGATTEQRQSRRFNVFWCPERGEPPLDIPF